MSEVVYLIGAGASYGQRGIKKETGETLEGCIIRGLPIVNQLEPAIEWYCKTIQKKGSMGQHVDDSEYPTLYKELKWLKSKSQTYPTIDTFAKKLTVTHNWLELESSKIY